MLFDDPVLRRVVETLWQAIPKHFPTVELDGNVLMPNHLHGVLWIVGEGRGEVFANESMSIGTPAVAEILEDWDSRANTSPLRPTPGSLSVIIGNFKSITTRRINQIRRAQAAVGGAVSTNVSSAMNANSAAIRQYIRENPVNWALDKENPQL